MLSMQKKKKNLPFYPFFSWSQMTAVEMQFMFHLCLFKLKAIQIEKPEPKPNPATGESFSLTHQVLNLNYDLLLK